METNMKPEFNALNHQLSQLYGFEVELDHRPSAYALSRVLDTRHSVLQACNGVALNTQLKCYKDKGTNYEK